MGERPNDIKVILNSENPLKELNLNENAELSMAINVAKQVLKQSDEITTIHQLKEELVTILEEEKRSSKQT